MNYWEEIAEKVAEDFGVMVDDEDRFFVCPECGEPIYEDDWKESDCLGIDGEAWYCPICGELLAER